MIQPLALSLSIGIKQLGTRRKVDGKSSIDIKGLSLFWMDLRSLAKFSTIQRIITTSCVSKIIHSNHSYEKLEDFV
jgi:hypothetical protein